MKLLYNFTTNKKLIFIQGGPKNNSLLVS